MAILTNMAAAYNYTKIRRREKRIYSIYQTTISESGIVMSSLKLAALFLLPFNILGVIICYLTNTFLYNPLLFMSDPNTVGYFYIFVFVIPFILGFWMNQYKIHNYKAWDYLKMYFMPKKPVNQFGDKIVLKGYSIDGVIEKIN